MVIASLAGRYYWQYVHLGALEIRGGEYQVIYTTDIIYAPLFVYGMANILQFIRKSFVFKILMKSAQSLLMWFIHCPFFNVCREITQPILYVPKNPVMVLIWGLLLCYLPSVMIDLLLKRVLQWKNRFI